jgi:hypothetical protein
LCQLKTKINVLSLKKCKRGKGFAKHLNFK